MIKRTIFRYKGSYPYGLFFDQNEHIPIPKGFPARVIMPDGTFKTETHIRLVPGGGGVKTAYPLIP